MLLRCIYRFERVHDTGGLMGGLRFRLGSSSQFDECMAVIDISFGRSQFVYSYSNQTMLLFAL